MIKFLEWAESYYIKNGKVTNTFTLCRLSVTPVVQHYGSKSISEFGPLSLKFIREKMLELNLTRTHINKRVAVIKQAFRWGVENELVPADVLHALQAVTGLKAGRTTAKDNPPVEPVADDIVEKTIPHLPPIVADMVRIQRLIGGRPQDVCNMRVCDIQTDGDIWVYSLYTHKTEHRGKQRILPIGPRAQQILTPYLIQREEEPQAFLFSPIDTLRLQRAEKRRTRKTKVQPSQLNRAKAKPKRTPKDQYTARAYNRAITRACVKAGTTTTITGLTADTEYEFQVRASNNGGNSNWSESVIVITDYISTFRKRQRIFRCTGKTANSVSLAWNAVSDAIGYEVQYRQSGTTTWTNVSVSPVPHWAPNQLRHSAATEIADKFGVHHAKETLGHSSIRTTERYYIAPIPEKALEVAKKIG